MQKQRRPIMLGNYMLFGRPSTAAAAQNTQRVPAVA